MDLTGNVIGTHSGLPWYTIGQRRGLGISAGKPLYIVDIIPAKNQIVVGPEENLYQAVLQAQDLHYIAGRAPALPLAVKAKIRYRTPPGDAIISPENSGLRVEFSSPQRAITRGQSVVFYQRDEVLGGGIISGVGYS